MRLAVRPGPGKHGPVRSSSWTRRGPRRLALLAWLAAPAFGQGVERVSVGPAGLWGDNDSWESTISADGRKVVFVSIATTLVPGDVNGHRDAFLHDRLSRLTSLVSVAPDGTQADGDSGGPAISADGRWVAFYTLATNLVPGDTNGLSDVYLRELSSGALTRVSLAPGGAQADGPSQLPAVSADARFVAFSSDATNLVSGDTNGMRDVFVHDRQTLRTERVSVASDGSQSDNRCDAAAISADGRYVAFVSPSGLLVPGDANGELDVFRHDRLSGQTTRVSVGPGGVEGDGHSGFEPATGFMLCAISADGRFVGFHSVATNLVPGDTNALLDAFVHDCLTGQTERVSVASGGAQASGPSLITHSPSISADGRFVAFHSFAADLVAGDTNGRADVFVRDRLLDATTRVSLGPSGLEGDGDSLFGVLSGDGSRVSFHSLAANLVPGDANGVLDVFVADPGGVCLTPERYCAAKPNSLACLPAIATQGAPSLSAGGFSVTAAQVLNNQSGILIYSTAGAAAAPFQGGLLCVAQPKRTGLQPSGGSAGSGTDCSGAFALDFTAFAAGGPDPALVAGQPVWAQYWSRDPGLPLGQASSLTDAVLFRLCP